MTTEVANSAVIHVVSMNGAGTHMMMDILRAAGLQWETESRHFWPAVVWAERDRNARFQFGRDKGTPVIKILDDIYARWAFTPQGNPLTDENTFACYQRMLNSYTCCALFLAHQFHLVYGAARAHDGTCEDDWSIDDRDRARDLIVRATHSAGRRFFELCLLRHPIDIYLSNLNRFGASPDRRLKLLDRIECYLQLIREIRDRNNVALVRYEDICCGKSSVLRTVFNGLKLNADVIQQALAVPHRGYTEKWREHDFADIAEAIQRLSPWMPEFGYEVPSAHASSRMATWTRRAKVAEARLSVEVSLIHRIVTGDYSAANAFTHHRFSRLAAIYLRLAVFWPPFRRNYRNLYLEHYNGNAVPMEAVWKSLKRHLFR